MKKGNVLYLIGLYLVGELFNKIHEIIKMKQKLLVKEELIKKTITVLAFVCGIQSTAEFLSNWRAYDHIIFADTGDEKPETYFYMKTYIMPFVEKHNIPFVVVRNGKYLSLLEYCKIHKQVPMRNFRWCTDKFKRFPINKFCRKLGAHFKNPVVKALCISIDESERVNENAAVTSEPKYIKLSYPLLDRKISRSDCKKIIADAGFPVPIKSGCWYCPFAKKEEWRRLKIEKPELFEEACKMEEQNDKFPERTLKFPKPLRMINFDYSLNDFDPDMEDIQECDSGHCLM